MIPQKYRFIYLLYLVFPVTTSYATPNATESQKNAKQNPSILWLQEDLDQHLKKKFLKSKLIQKLLNLVFIRPSTSNQQSQPPPFSTYEGRRIGSIQLHRKGIFGKKATPWSQVIDIITPKTRSWVIKQQLHFKKGDKITTQQLIDSQHRLNRLPFLSKSKLTVHEDPENSDKVNVHITTQDRFPIIPSVDMSEMQLSISHNNLVGWGHKLKGQISYNHGLGYGCTYQATDITYSGITGELQYIHGEKKGIVGLKAFKQFNNQNKYAGQVVISHVKREKERYLDGYKDPQLTPWSYWDQNVWLGRAFKLRQNEHQAKIFLIGSVARKRFTKRPPVMPSGQHRNAFFHHSRLFLMGSIGFSLQGHHKDQWTYNIGPKEHTLYGSKIILTGGYQLGEFVDRPYLRVDITQGRHIRHIGHLYSAINVGGFLHHQSVEQGIVKLHLGYFTPLLTLGKQHFRHFINVKYLAGFNMFTGELISTNAHKVASNFRDPFMGGTKRLQLESETVVFTPKRLFGCQTAAIGFFEAVQLKDDQNRVRQSVLCKAFGFGLILAPPRFIFDALQFKLGYHPLVDDIGWEIGGRVACALDDCYAKEPNTIPFVEY